MSEFSEKLEALLAECEISEPEPKKDYTVEISVKLRIRDVEDEYEAQNYIEDFIGQGLASITESDDEYDDHYRLEESHANWRTFTEVEPNE